MHTKAQYAQLSKIKKKLSHVAEVEDLHVVNLLFRYNLDTIIFFSENDKTGIYFSFELYQVEKYKSFSSDKLMPPM